MDTDPSNSQYELTGVLIHSGSANAGHYYSFCKETEGENAGEWFEFNDMHVSKFDIQNLARECFGSQSSQNGS